MYQYKYIPVDTGGGFLSDTREHRELIDAYAAEGWRYVGFFPGELHESWRDQKRGPDL